MTELTRLEIQVEEEDADVLQGLLALHVAHGWEELSKPTGETVAVVHSGHAGFCAELQATILSVLPAALITASTVEEKNWAEAWKAFFTPVEGGTHFLVLAPWMEEERKAATRIPLLIEPKMAFGTGHHATTSLCLDAISGLFTDGSITAQTRFLDLGTGSGILGLACAKLGLRGQGVDIDPASVDNAQENRALNGIAPEHFSIALGGVDAAKGPYDLILANILAAPLREMAPHIVAALGRKADGTPAPLVLSGMLDIQAHAVEAVYTALGMPAPRRLSRGEWVALVFG